MFELLEPDSLCIYQFRSVASMATKQLKRMAEKFLPKSRFARSVSLLAGGAAAGQAIVVAASPLLTRLYSPEDLGVLAVFASILSILGIVASLRYQLAIPLPKSDEDAANITVLSVVVVLCMALLTAIVTIPLRQTISEHLNMPLLANYIWLLPLGLFLLGIYDVLNYWAIRKKAFGTIAQTQLTQSIGMVSVQVGGYAFGPIALLIGRIAGHTAGLLRLGAALSRDWKCFENVRVSGIKASLKGYRTFPLVSTWSGLSSAGGSQLPPIMIAIFIGPAAAGLYAITHRVLSLPIGVISKSIGDVFYSEAIEAELNGKLGPLVVDIYSKLVSGSLPIAILLIVSAPEVFRVVFGENWAQAGELASWMSVWVFFQFATTPPGRVFLILDRHGYALFFQLAFLLTTVASIIVGGFWFNDLIKMMAVLVLGRSIIYGVRFITILNLVGEDVKQVWIPILYNLPYAIFCSVPVYFAFEVLGAPYDQRHVVLSLFVVSLLMSIVPCIRIFRK